MVYGLGIDIVEINRIQRLWVCYGEKFAHRILHKTELTILPKNNIVQFLSSRFAAKEATVKALGTGFSNGISPRDIAVSSLPNGQPMLILYNMAKVAYEELPVQNIRLSLSHEKKYTVAVVLIE